MDLDPRRSHSSSPRLLAAMTDPRQRPNPFVGVLPEDLRLGSLAGAMGALVKAVAWDLGERYDRHLSRSIGPDWIVQLSRERHVEPPTLHDPSFVFVEPEVHPDSPVWGALPPRDATLVDRFRRARITRNRWEHEPTRQSHETFLNGVDRFLDLTTEVGLSSVDQCRSLRDRVLELRRHGGRLPRGDELQELTEILARAREEQAVAVREAAEQSARADRAGADADEARREAEALREMVALAQERVEHLAALEQAELQRRRLSSEEEEPTFEPGDPWTLSHVGSRVVSLKPRLVDLYDADLGVLLSQEMGSVASDAAGRWLAVMPRGGTVHLTSGGHAAARVDGRLVYLGRLDVVSDVFRAGAVAAGPWLPGSFVLTTGPDVVELDTERSLLGSGGSGAAEAVRRIDEALPIDEVFRLTESGIVTVMRGGQSIQVVDIDLGSWFASGETESPG